MEMMFSSLQFVVPNSKQTKVDFSFDDLGDWATSRSKWPKKSTKQVWRYLESLVKVYLTLPMCSMRNRFTSLWPYS